ncbi:MAG TPA: VOC family protein [Clostridia bacterium]|nr:VOC family protein [Clostridia bacterium]
MTKLKFAAISVKNIDESFRFYTEVLKLKEAERFSPREGIYIAFVQDDDNNKIELIQNELEKPSFIYDENSVVTLCFSVDNLDETMKSLNEKGITVKKGPRNSPSSKFIVVEDPNGIEIALHEDFAAN